MAKWRRGRSGKGAAANRSLLSRQEYVVMLANMSAAGAGFALAADADADQEPAAVVQGAEIDAAAERQGEAGE